MAWIKINKRLYKLFWAISLFMLSFIIGVFGYMLIEDWNLVESFYMTAITIGTVGFTEVHPMSSEGRVFTSIYIIFNLGVFALFASVVTSYLFEGELRDVLDNYITDRKVQKLQNHIIICGFGKNGHKASEELSKTKLPFVVIERDAQLFKEILNNYSKNKNISFIEGDATQDEILLLAGIERAKSLITTLPLDASNVFVTLTAKQLNPRVQIISRVVEESSERKLIRAGADKLVRPDMIGGIYMANLVTRPRVVDFLDMIGGTGELKMEEFCCQDFNDGLRYKSILELDIRNKTGAHVIGYKQEGKPFLVNPNPHTKITDGDIMIVLGTVSQIKEFARTYTHKKLSKL